MMNKKMIKIICIVLAALMALSCLAVLTQVFAVGAAAPIPVTGDNDARYVVPIVIAALAVLIVVICLVIPKLKKKDGDK